jgi:hypothetical protein
MINRDIWSILNSSKAGKERTEEKGYIREKREEKEEIRKRLNYTIYVDFLV